MLPATEFRTRIKVVEVITEAGKALGVVSVDRRQEVNGERHHTTDYQTADLVVRRGAPFDLALTFDRPVKADVDSVILQLSVGSKPQESKQTLVRLRLDLTNGSTVTAFPSGWSAVVSSIKESVIAVSVTAPAEAIIGRYQIYVETRVNGLDDEKSLRRYEMENDDVIVIFNPWCPDDVVYMAEAAERQEYVLNDTGRIWVGSSTSHAPRPWSYGQFDDPCLDAALHLLDKAELGDSARHSPVAVVRAISALANRNDDDGVLEGRWSQPYPKGTTEPWAWIGSVSILQQYMKADKPVRFGQCWVFSGVVTTLLRALGIPTRSVTNFESAHDCDASMTIDTHFDCKGDPIEEKNDSVWNFHVWNESWFRRPDLPDGYDGWQVHDATPQEVSEGVMRCGPAPLKAVKEGHIYLNYDVPFVFSEVNGDRVHWRENELGETEVISIDAHAVGKFISTKAVGSNDRHDLTNDYKYPEGSAEERRVVEFVNRFSHTAKFKIYKKEITEDVTFRTELPDVTIGSDVTVRVAMRNKSSAARAVSGRLTLMTGYYTGVPGTRLLGENYDIQLPPGREESVQLTLGAGDYVRRLNPEASLQLYVSLAVADTGQHYVTTRAFTLAKPALVITVPEVVKVDSDYEGVVSFTNPLAVPLTGLTITIEGASLATADVYHLRKAVKPGETVTQTFALKPRRAGRREIEAALTSDQLCGVTGSYQFKVLRDVTPMETQ